MCGRYTLTEPQDIGSILEVELPALLEPRYNVAPTDAMPVVRVREGKRVCRLYRWGLVPSWADDPRIGSSLINARSESVATKPAFRSAFQKRRCFVPSTGFVEWKREGKAKLPYWIRPTDGGLLVFAGLWEAWRDPATEVWTRSFTILTGPPNAIVEPLHDRMPVVLERADWAAWIDPDLRRRRRGICSLRPTLSSRRCR